MSLKTIRKFYIKTKRLFKKAQTKSEVIKDYTFVNGISVINLKLSEINISDIIGLPRVKFDPSDFIGFPTIQKD